jgi:hypothetical protein
MEIRSAAIDGTMSGFMWFARALTVGGIKLAGEKPTAKIP